MQGQIDNNFSNHYQAGKYMLNKNLGSIGQTHGFDGEDRMVTRSLTLTPDGGSILAGYTDVNNDQQPLLLKFDAQNQLLWQKLYPAVAGMNYQSRAIVEDRSGSLVMALLRWNDDEVTSAVAKTNSHGEKVWEKAFPDVVLNTVAVGPLGNYYAGGRTTMDNRDAVLIKLNSSGSVIWQRSILRGNPFGKRFRVPQVPSTIKRSHCRTAELL